MFSHIFIGVTDFSRALAFYRALMPVLGVQERFCEPERPWAGWQSSPDPRPLLLIGTPFDGRPHQPGNGPMTAFLAADRATVDRAHAAALAHGGRCEGPPGLRPSTTRTTTAPISGTPRATSCVWPATRPDDHAIHPGRQGGE